nr:unnamed protein product [Callosobruchus chinensis]
MGFMVKDNEDFFDFTLHNNRLVNRHNFHYYSDEYIHFYRMLIANIHRWALSIWGGIIGSLVIGPYFFDAKQLSRTFLEDLPLNIEQKMWLQLDGTAAHYQLNVRVELNRQ